MLNLDFKQAIDSLQANPIACGSLCLRALEELSEGKVKIVDPSNPFVYLMETSVILYTNSYGRRLLGLRSNASLALTSSINLRAPGRRHTLYIHLRVSKVLCFW